MRIASLPMYEVPAMADANDAFWDALAFRLRRQGVRDVPIQLTRDIPYDVLTTDPRLFFTQICGYPFTKYSPSYVRLLGAPVYAAVGCETYHHRSFLLVPATSPAAHLASLKGSRAAINSRDSNTGRNLLWDTLCDAGAGPDFFREIHWTGSHQASIQRLSEGGADVAAVDCVTYALLERSSPALLRGVRVLTTSRAVPTLPFVTSRHVDAATATELAASLRAVTSSLAETDVGTRLLLRGVADVPEETYEPLRTLGVGLEEYPL